MKRSTLICLFHVSASSWQYDTVLRKSGDFAKSGCVTGASRKLEATSISKSVASASSVMVHARITASFSAFSSRSRPEEGGGRGTEV